jgi:hypothetical protein
MTASLYGDGASESMTGVVYSAPPPYANHWGGPPCHPKALTREHTYRALVEYIEKQTG